MVQAKEQSAQQMSAAKTIQGKAKKVFQGKAKQRSGCHSKPESQIPLGAQMLQEAGVHSSV